MASKRKPKEWEEERRRNKYRAFFLFFSSHFSAVISWEYATSCRVGKYVWCKEKTLFIINFFLLAKHRRRNWKKKICVCENKKFSHFISLSFILRSVSDDVFQCLLMLCINCWRLFSFFGWRLITFHTIRTSAMIHKNVSFVEEIWLSLFFLSKCFPFVLHPVQ